MTELQPRRQEINLNPITNKLVVIGIMKAIKFSFLLVRDEDFHSKQHDLLLPENQAHSISIGIINIYIGKGLFFSGNIHYYHI